MRTLIITILLSISVQAHSTSVFPKELYELVALSDHILAVKIVDVTMINEEGKQLTDPSSRTGPGTYNTIRLHAKVLDNGIIKTSSAKLPETIIIPLFQLWHYSLGQVQGEKGNEIIVLLKGNSYEPAYPALFRQSLQSREEIIQLLNNPSNKCKQQDC